MCQLISRHHSALYICSSWGESKIAFQDFDFVSTDTLITLTEIVKYTKLRNFAVHSDNNAYVQLLNIFTRFNSFVVNEIC